MMVKRVKFIISLYLFLVTSYYEIFKVNILFSLSIIQDLMPDNVTDTISSLPLPLKNINPKVEDRKLTILIH